MKHETLLTDFIQENVFGFICKMTAAWLDFNAWLCNMIGMLCDNIDMTL